MANYSIINKNENDVYHFAVPSASYISSLPSCAIGSLATVTGSGSQWLYDGSNWQFQGSNEYKEETIGKDSGFALQTEYCEGMTWDDWSRYQNMGGNVGSTWYTYSKGSFTGKVNFPTRFARFPGHVNGHIQIYVASLLALKS